MSRIGRLHWLTGRRSADENWDAYEAPGGRALFIASGPQVSWSEAKIWLLDLAHELQEAARDRSLPPLHLDRLWLRGDGRVVLLDFPAPGAESGSAASDATPAMTPVAFLATVGTLLLNALEATRGPAAVPLSARTMIAEWGNAAPPDFDAARAALTAVAAGVDDVRRVRRGLPVALAATPVLVIVLGAALMLPYLYRFMRNPQTVEILSGLSALQNPNPRAARMRDPEVRAAIERYLAGRYGSLLADEAFWGTLIMSRLATLRPVARDIVARHPDVPAEELTRAMSVIAPERERWARQSDVQVRGMLTIGGIIVTALTGLVLAIVVGFSLLSAALVPGGLVTRALGYAVVTRAGHEIGRSRSLLRAGVAWAPAIAWLVYLALSPKIQGFVPSPPLPWVGWALTVLLLAAGAAWTLASVARGPHDRVMGTWVVAR